MKTTTSPRPWRVEEETEDGETTMLAIRNGAGDYIVAYYDDIDEMKNLRGDFELIVRSVNALAEADSAK